MSGRYSNRRELCRRLRAEVAVHAGDVAVLYAWMKKGRSERSHQGRPEFDNPDGLQS